MLVQIKALLGLCLLLYNIRRKIIFLCLQGLCFPPPPTHFQRVKASLNERLHTLHAKSKTSNEVVLDTFLWALVWETLLCPFFVLSPELFAENRLSILETSLLVCKHYHMYIFPFRLVLITVDVTVDVVKCGRVTSLENYNWRHIWNFCAPIFSSFFFRIMALPQLLRITCHAIECYLRSSSHTCSRLPNS